MVRGMVAQGLGVSLLITRPASELSYDGASLVCLPLSDALPAQRLVMAQSHHFSPTPVAQAVMAEIRAMFDNNSQNQI
jgi:DNA-binding transcriptional LysR family regulator